MGMKMLFGRHDSVVHDGRTRLPAAYTDGCESVYATEVEEAGGCRYLFCQSRVRHEQSLFAESRDKQGIDKRLADEGPRGERDKDSDGVDEEYLRVVSQGVRVVLGDDGEMPIKGFEGLGLAEGADVVLLGNLDHFEVWDRAEFEGSYGDFSPDVYCGD